MRAAQAEQEVFGFDHAELGARVARKWKLAETLESVVRHHHQPEALPGLGESERLLTALVSVASMVCNKISRGTEPADGPLTQTAAWQTLGLDEDQEAEILAFSEEHAKEASSALG